ncbi:MAG: hypothetical protein JXP73_07795 [Deltaproteobacteria bacterium]|nr:hypothetical protein [Deltaproteobacteria bacterium]
MSLIQASSNKAIPCTRRAAAILRARSLTGGDIKSGWDVDTTSNDTKFLEALLASVEDAYCMVPSNAGAHIWEFFSTFD